MRARLSVFHCLTDLFCGLCDVSCNSEASLQTHLSSARHRRALERAPLPRAFPFSPTAAPSAEQLTPSTPVASALLQQISSPVHCPSSSHPSDDADSPDGFSAHHRDVEEYSDSG